MPYVLEARLFEPRGVEMRPHWFEDLEVGQEFATARRRVEDADLAAYAALSGDHNPLHRDDAAAVRSGFAGRIAPGVLGVAIATGLLNGLGLTRGTLVALLGVRWDFRLPVRPGDELRGRVRVEETRPSSRGGRGVVRLRMLLLNQRDEVVQEGELSELVRCRDSPEERPGAAAPVDPRRS
jgi:acyl dehydratase